MKQNMTQIHYDVTDFNWFHLGLKLKIRVTEAEASTFKITERKSVIPITIFKKNKERKAMIARGRFKAEKRIPHFLLSFISHDF